MNKYSSKAVKTAATVGMSLAMVLSNAAPVFAADISAGKKLKFVILPIQNKQCQRLKML